MKRKIGNLSLNVEERGSGEVSLVFLHYWGGTHRTWNKVVSQLENSFLAVTYDMRGWGKSDPAENGYSIAELANDAALLIQQLGLQKYVLVGHSMGGKVAQLLASRHPVGLVGLILVAPAAPIPIRLPDQALQQQIHAYDNRDTVLQAIAFLSAHTLESDVVEQIVEDSLSGVPEAKLAWPTSAILEDISSNTLQITVPTLVLAGEQDRVDSIEQHRREIIGRIPNARLSVVVDSGHLIPIDEPVALARSIADFVAHLPA
jgi:pimeloyl-ACP methyl ester carboxylesterase